MKLLKGKITISRMRGNMDVEKPVRIELTDTASRVSVVEIYLSLAEFAEALTGMGCVPCEFEWSGTACQLVGMQREHKDERIELPGDGWLDCKDKKAVQELRRRIAVYEVDGWRGDDSYAFNSHYCSTGKDGKRYARISFDRYVGEDGKPVEVPR